MPNWAYPEFDWDDGNIDHLISRHSVSPKEAEEVFTNAPYIKREGDAYYVYGETSGGRLLFIACEDRRGMVRVFSAHDMDAQERRLYGRNRKRR